MDDDGGERKALDESTQDVAQQNRIKYVLDVDSQRHFRAEIHESSAGQNAEDVAHDGQARNHDDGS